MTLDEIRALDGAKLRYALMDLAKGVPDAIALGRGDPDLATPDFVVEAGKEALRRPEQPLQPVAGMPELRAAIADRSAADHGRSADAEQVLVTTGGQEGLFLIMSALLDPGDEILVPDPRYTSYDQAIEHAGGVSVTVPTQPEDAFDLRADAIEPLITDKTKALLLVSPSNPTGGIVTREQAQKIAELAKKHDFIVIADEIYGKFVWPPHEHVSMGALPGMEDHVITLSGFSKAWAMTGWRVGYLIAPSDAIDAMARIKASTTGPVANVSQSAALAAARGSDACIDAFREIYAERRELLGRGLRDMGLDYTDPRGGFFFWADSSSTGLRALELSYLLLEEARVLVFPGTGFGQRWSDYLRITTLQPTDVLREAIERMTPVVQRYASEAKARA
ncbi:MAG: aminotransferase class I/II-fold pyridoxal phosphate-dependent enzyme [Trueperaceae bacterium]